MDANTKTIELGDVRIIVERLSYGNQLQRSALLRKFLPPQDDNATQEETDYRIAVWNLIIFSTQTREVDGMDFAPLHSSDSAEAFQSKLAAFLDTDNEVITAWIEAVDEMSKSLAPASQLPLEALSDEERKDPKSQRRSGKQKPTSASASAPEPQANSA